MYGRGGRTRTYDGRASLVLETSALAAKRHPYMYGGESGTRTLKPLQTNGFQDRATTNYHNSPYIWSGMRESHPLGTEASGFTDPRAYFNALIPEI